MEQLLTDQQIEQKKQLLAEKMKAMKALYNELAEAGAIELSDEDLDGASGGAMSFIHEQFHMLYILPIDKQIASSWVRLHSDKCFRWKFG